MRVTRTRVAGPSGHSKSPREQAEIRRQPRVAALSRVCHYHCYELAPAAELDRWLTETADLIGLLHGAERPGP
jgi:hypothetical protein